MAPSEVKLIVYHRFPGIELISPICIGSDAKSYPSPDRKVVFGSKTQVNFKSIRSYKTFSGVLYISTLRKKKRNESFSGVLMYKLQRENTNPSNVDVISSEEEATCTQFVIVWEINSSKKFSIASYLIEHDKDSVWDEDKLLQLTKYYKPANIQYGHVEETWLMHDNTVLMTSLNITPEGGCYKLVMNISKTSIKDGTQRPLYISLDR
jgi:hypothetical protein